MKAQLEIVLGVTKEGAIQVRVKLASELFHGEEVAATFALEQSRKIAFEVLKNQVDTGDNLNKDLSSLRGLL